MQHQQQPNGGIDWCSLPEEVLALVGQFLPDQDLAGMRLVCDRWRRGGAAIIQQLRKPLPPQALKHTVGLPYVKELSVVAKGTTINIRDFKVLGRAFLEGRLAERDSLTDLSVTGCTRVGHALLFAILETCRAKPTITPFKSLVRLQLLACDASLDNSIRNGNDVGISMGNMRDVCASLPHLKTLTLEAPQANAQDGVNVLQGLAGLEFLDLRRLNEPTVERLTSCLAAHLKFLLLQDSSIRHATIVTKLEALEVRGWWLHAPAYAFPPPAACTCCLLPACTICSTCRPDHARSCTST